MSDQFSNTQQIRKPAVTSKGGIVASQSRKAAEVGAAVLAAGGDCVDAVIATTFALGVLEPWMSGLGGGGAMVLYRAREDRYEVIDYGMRAPNSLRPEDYPLTGDGAASDIFPWPRVKDDRNLHGPGSIAVPGVVAGMEEAHRRHAKMPWQELLAPSIKLAGEGLLVDWWTTLMIASSAADLRRYPASAAAYLKDGLPPNRAMGHQVQRADAAGPAEGDVVLSRRRRRARFLPGRSGAQHGGRHSGRRRRPSCRRSRRLPCPWARTADDSLSRRQRLRDAGADLRADPGAYAAPAAAEICKPAAADRMRRPTWNMPGAAIGLSRTPAGHGRRRRQARARRRHLAPACTTHFSVVDRDGNMAAVTQTLLSTFGSKFVTPQSGITMNNGIMWFDPTPGKPNSLEPGKRCLTNYTPVLAQAADGGGCRRLRRTAHLAGGDAASVLRDGLRHGPRRRDPRPAHRRQRRRRGDRRCAAAAPVRDALAQVSTTRKRGCRPSR